MSELHDNTMPICRNHFSAMTFDDADLQAQILEMFEQQLCEFVLQMQETVSLEAQGRVLHRFKGSARGVGAFALADALERAERRVQEGGVACSRNLMGLLDVVRQDVQVLKGKI